MENISDKLEQIEMALKREGYKMPVKPAQPDEVKETSEDKLRASVKINKSPSVRFKDPKDFIRRDDLKNPYW